jgi:hypothetical protein
MNPAEIHHGPATFAADNADSTGIPLFHAAWLFSLGIVVAHYLWLRPSYLLIALLPAAVLCGVSALRAQRIAWLPLIFGQSAPIR